MTNTQFYSIVVTTLSCFSLYSMEEPTKKFICSLITIKFPKSQTNEQSIIASCAERIKKNSENFPDLYKEETQKYIVDSIVAKIKPGPYKNHLAIAQELHSKDESYNTLYNNIKNAFSLTGKIQDSWYANTTSSCRIVSSNLFAHKHISHNMTPLGLAVTQMDYNRCAALILAQANLDTLYSSTNHDALSPLHNAIWLKDIIKTYQAGKKEHIISLNNIISLLVQHGADANVKITADTGDVTPYAFAIQIRDKQSTIQCLNQKLSAYSAMLLTEEDQPWFECVKQSENNKNKFDRASEEREKAKRQYQQYFSGKPSFGKTRPIRVKIKKIGKLRVKYKKLVAGAGFEPATFGL